jgi:hypothetical protein
VEEDVSYTRTESGVYPPCVVTEWNPSGDPPILLSLLAAKTELCEAKSVRQLGLQLGSSVPTANGTVSSWLLVSHWWNHAEHKVQTDEPYYR